MVQPGPFFRGRICLGIFPGGGGRDLCPLVPRGPNASPPFLCRGHVVLIPEYIFPLGYYLIPFTGVVGVVIAVMCTILVRDHRGPAGRGAPRGAKLSFWPLILHTVKLGVPSAGRAAPRAARLGQVVAGDSVGWCSEDALSWSCRPLVPRDGSLLLCFPRVLRIALLAFVRVCVFKPPARPPQ